MQDEKILDLFWQRKESAIDETERKYRTYLHCIAFSILGDLSDCQETVNDTLLKAWNSIPPHRPAVLSTYLGKIVRQTAIDRYRSQHRQKRNGGEYALSLSELQECISDGDKTAEESDAKLLGESISRFLKAQKKEARTVFVQRYYFSDPIRAIAQRHGISEAKTTSLLHRTRLALREHLQKEGFLL